MSRRSPQSRYFLPTLPSELGSHCSVAPSVRWLSWPLVGTPDGYDANTQKCFTFGILIHSIKICKYTTKEIKKNSIIKAALPFRGLNTRTGLITEHRVTLLGYNSHKMFSTLKCTPLVLPQRAGVKGHFVLFFPEISC